MTALVLTFSGSYLELLAWFLLLAFIVGVSFVAGWAFRGLHDDEGADR